VGISEQEQEMFKKILVANRGEIAMRVIRACRELNIATAAIYSEADSTGIYVKKADEAYLVGPGPVKGFLDGQQIVELALRIGADAIPGTDFSRKMPISRSAVRPPASHLSDPPPPPLR
jgi:pyruvate carboxylase subunit A